MDDAEYTQTQQQLILVAGLVARMDLPGFLERIQHAATLAPIFDPTLWMKGHVKLDMVRRLAVSANKLREEMLALVREESEQRGFDAEQQRALRELLGLDETPSKG